MAWASGHPFPGASCHPKRRPCCSVSPPPPPLHSSSTTRTNHHSRRRLLSFPPQYPHTNEAAAPGPASNVSPETKSPKPKLSIRARLSQLCKDGRPDIALRIFDALPQPPTLLWNTLIIGFICNAMPHEALRLYARMNFSSTSSTRSRAAPLPDFYTFSSVLKACALTRQLSLGKAVHCRILRTQLKPPTRVLANSLLSMYSTCMDSSPPKVDLVLHLFDAMRARNVVTWNTMIAWYVKTSRADQAVAHFKLMLKTGIKPSAVSFVNVFKAIADLRDGKLADMLYGLLLKFGSEYTDDLFVVGSAIFMYCELSGLHSGRRVFDLCDNRNVQVWNTMIDGYVRNEQPCEALELFVALIASTELLVLDEVTFLAATMAASQMQEFKLGQQIHSSVIKCWAELPVILLNALIVMYSRCDAVRTAFLVFDKMSERDIVTWNTMVSSFVQNGFDEEGLLLVREMQKQGVKVDAITAIALLSAASNLRDLQLGKQTHAYIFRHAIEFEGMDSYLIDVYAKSGLIETAEKLFRKNRIYERDQVTWNAMVTGYVQNGQYDEAIALFKQMTEHNRKPNSVTLASILPACDPASGISLGKQLHGYAVRHAMDRNVFVGTALVDMYAKGGIITHAENMFNIIPEKNSVTYTTMILGYGQNGRGESALSLFHAMSEHGLKPDAVTFVAVLSACSYAGLVDEGLNIFDSMERKYGILPTYEHSACVVDILGRAGRVKEAYAYVQEAMGDEGNVVGIWGSLLGACRMHKEFKLGELVANRLFKIGRGNELAGYHVLLSNMHAETGQWEGVDGVRKGMRERGLRKEAGCSWIEVGRSVHCFVSRDQRHYMCKPIYAMLEELSAVMILNGCDMAVDEFDVFFEG